MELSGIGVHASHMCSGRNFQLVGSHAIKDMLGDHRTSPLIAFGEFVREHYVNSIPWLVSLFGEFAREHYVNSIPWLVSLSNGRLFIREEESVIFEMSLALASVASGLDPHSGFPVLVLQPSSSEQAANVSEGVVALVAYGGKDAATASLEAICAGGCIHKDLSAVYQLQSSVLAKGTFASVWPAVGRGSGCVVAAKLLEQTCVPMCGSSDSDQAVAPREALVLLAAQSHPNILRFLGIFGSTSDPDDEATDEKKAWRWSLVTECCPEGDVWSLVHDKGPCHEDQATEIMSGLMSALEHLHARRLVHRDVKAENVLLKDGGKPVLADFGLCVLLGHDDDSTKPSLGYLTPDVLVGKTGVCLADEREWHYGSPGYIAPELVAREGSYGGKVDVFASGVVYYFLFSGRLPFSSGDIVKTMRRTLQCHVEFDNPHFACVKIDRLQLIKLLLSREARARPSSTEALALIVGGRPSFEDASALVSAGRSSSSEGFTPAPRDTCAREKSECELNTSAGASSVCNQPSGELNTSVGNSSVSNQPSGELSLRSVSEQPSGQDEILVRSGSMQSSDEHDAPHQATSGRRSINSHSRLLHRRLFHQPELRPDARTGPIPVPPRMPRRTSRHGEFSSA